MDIDRFFVPDFLLGNKTNITDYIVPVKAQSFVFAAEKLFSRTRMRPCARSY